MKNIIMFLLLTFSLGACFVHAAKNEHAKIWTSHKKYKRSSNRPCKCCRWGAWYYTKNPCEHCKPGVKKVSCGSGDGEFVQVCKGHCD